MKRRRRNAAFPFFEPSLPSSKGRSTEGEKEHQEEVSAILKNLAPVP